MFLSSTDISISQKSPEVNVKYESNQKFRESNCKNGTYNRNSLKNALKNGIIIAYHDLERITLWEIRTIFSCGFFSKKRENNI